MAALQPPSFVALSFHDSQSWEIARSRLRQSEFSKVFTSDAVASIIIYMEDTSILAITPEETEWVEKFLKRRQFFENDYMGHFEREYLRYFNLPGWTPHPDSESEPEPSFHFKVNVVYVLYKDEVDELMDAAKMKGGFEVRTPGELATGTGEHYHRLVMDQDRHVWYITSPDESKKEGKTKSIHGQLMKTFPTKSPAWRDPSSEAMSRKWAALLEEMEEIDAEEVEGLEGLPSPEPSQSYSIHVRSLPSAPMEVDSPASKASSLSASMDISSKASSLSASMDISSSSSASTEVAPSLSASMDISSPPFASMEVDSPASKASSLDAAVESLDIS